MTAYVILDVDVHDPVGYEEYKKHGPPAVALYGGKYIVRGGKAETLEGDWDPKRMVVIEFENAERAKQWINSPEYSEGRKLGQRTATSRVIVVDGV